MTTLINKDNSQIRITAPEIIRWFSDFYVVKAEAGSRKGRILVVKSKDWTLVEEEPKKKGFGEKCECREVTWSEEDENNMGWLIAYLKGKNVYHSDELHKSVIKWLKSLRPQPKRKQSPALKKIVDNLTEERLAKTRAEMKTVEEEPTEDWREKRKKECPFRKADGCERYANVISECTGACSWVVDYPKLKEIQDKKEQKQPDVDLEKEIKKHTDLFHADIEYPLRLTAIKFYELGRKGGSK